MTIDYKKRGGVAVLITLSFLILIFFGVMLEQESKLVVGVSVLALCVAVYCIWRRKLYPFARAISPILSTAPITRQKAVEIYEWKLKFVPSINNQPKRSRNARIKNEYAVVGAQYQVSAKTVSDIWNRKTWVMATSHLWSSE